jgi:hypothetical protein
MRQLVSHFVVPEDDDTTLFACKSMLEGKVGVAWFLILRTYSNDSTSNCERYDTFSKYHSTTQYCRTVGSYQVVIVRS